MAESSDTNRIAKKNFEIFVDLIRAIVWPFIAAIALYTFLPPLYKTAELIPSVIERSDAITIAGLSLKLGKRLSAKASPEVKDVLRKISQDGLNDLLTRSFTSYWDSGKDSSAHPELSELLDLALIEQIPEAELDEYNQTSNKRFAFGIRPTKLGKDTQLFIKSLTVELAKVIATQPGVDQE